MNNAKTQRSFKKHSYEVTHTVIHDVRKSSTGMEIKIPNGRSWVQCQSRPLREMTETAMIDRTFSFIAASVTAIIVQFWGYHRIHQYYVSAS